MGNEQLPLNRLVTSETEIQRLRLKTNTVDKRLIVDKDVCDTSKCTNGITIYLILLPKYVKLAGIYAAVNMK